MCGHGRGLRGWTDGQAQAASGELRTGIDGSGGGGGVTYKDGRTGARVQAIIIIINSAGW